MNIAVLILLGLTLSLEVAALFRSVHLELKADEDDPGTFKTKLEFRLDPLGRAFAIGGIVLAAAAGSLSLWASGFQD